MPTQQIYQAPQKSFWMRAVFAFLKREYNIISNICPLPFAAHTFLDKYTLAAAQQYIYYVQYFDSREHLFSVYVPPLLPFCLWKLVLNTQKLERFSFSRAATCAVWIGQNIYPLYILRAHNTPSWPHSVTPVICNSPSARMQELANIFKFWGARCLMALKHLKKYTFIIWIIECGALVNIRNWQEIFYTSSCTCFSAANDFLCWKHSNGIAQVMVINLV